MTLSIIAALSENRAIGYENGLIYWLPNDLKRFKQLTTGNTIIMGRKTFESLPKGALPNRRNIVLTHDSGASFPGAETFHSLDEALAHCADGEHVYIIGGASVYKLALPVADQLCLTMVHDVPEHADTFFPEIDFAEWVEASREDYSTDEKHKFDYSFVTYERRRM